MIRPIDLGWLAGLLEGEGYFGLRTDGRPYVQLSMTDCDVVDRVHRILGFGYRGARRLPSGKTAYTWSASAYEDAVGLMMTLLPLMGERRAAKIIECLDAWKAAPLRRERMTHCKNGHPFSGDNLVIVYEGKYRKRRCRQCAADREARYRKRKRAA